MTEKQKTRAQQKCSQFSGGQEESSPTVITVPTGPKAGSKCAELSLCYQEVHSQDALDPSSKFPTSTLSICPERPGRPLGFHPELSVCSSLDRLISESVSLVNDCTSCDLEKGLRYSGLAPPLLCVCGDFSGRCSLVHSLVQMF